jgi:murein DD-endopeptidase MepM/ murein hydrolase activator NlpD
VIILCLPAMAKALKLEGKLVQGGMVIGKTAPGSSVHFQGKPIRVSPQGDFVIGFGRDAAPSQVVTIRLPGGNVEKAPIRIEQRSYRVQHIDGLPPRKVTPSPEDHKRIRREINLVKAVRQKDSPRNDFSQAFIWPVVGRISGVYGSQRILNGAPRRPHFGVDIAAPTGTPVRAAAGGIVSLVHADMFYSGGTLIVDHGHGLSTSYLHLHKILVREGQRVEQGEVIAQVGATGRVTGPHLHWGMNWFDTRLDPALTVMPMSKARALAAEK